MKRMAIIAGLLPILACSDPMSPENFDYVTSFNLVAGQPVGYIVLTAPANWFNLRGQLCSDPTDEHIIDMSEGERLRLTVSAGCYRISFSATNGHGWFEIDVAPGETVNVRFHQITLSVSHAD